MNPLNYENYMANVLVTEASHRMMFDNLLHDVWEIQEHLGLGTETRNEFFDDLYAKMCLGQITPQQAMTENYSTTNAMLKAKGAIVHPQD